MKQFVLVLATIGLALAAPREDDQFQSVKIVGGDEISIEDAPFQVVLLRNEFIWCGGSLIAPRIVVTAAHCVVPRKIPRLSMLKIRSASSRWDEGGLLVNVSKIVPHPGYQDCPECEPDNDIAILFLGSDAIVPGFPSKAIEMYETNTTFTTGTNGIVSGWGDVTDGGDDSPLVLRSVTLPLVSREYCVEVYGEEVVTERFICAGFQEGGKDSCQGDSGGPFTIGGKLAGVVAFGGGCALPEIPGAYSSVAAFRQWIRQTSGI